VRNCAQAQEPMRRGLSALRKLLVATLSLH
jgi:hypothetical protein